MLCEVIGEPIKRLARLIGEPIKLTGKRALRKALLDSAAQPRQRTRAGVAILIRGHVLAPQGHVQVPEASVLRSADGRLLQLRLLWAGHSLRRVNAYLPNDPALQRHFITERLGPLMEGLRQGEQLVLGGDFNFVENVALDRLRRGPRQP